MPGEIDDLRFDLAGQRIVWSAPAMSGGTGAVRYDVLVTDRPYAFFAGACEETNDGTDTEALVPRLPGPGKAQYYLVRAENTCGGTIGSNSNGSLRADRTCP